ncbi:DUF4198 domain-containing protein [Hydrocarboniclastica marina]|uniref:DUF4198 domain-containing protein n=1 Tax=Hydrocarboniclastica marina TaxID=2259620 RepID=A0A4P7XK31_9ALTE|nr:DUF4198 domain-containing protein [Hydrocarboniclastica marina]QCF27539.1 DUF4198 domain-containing protein [Hydrocarboniclastica marina]
MTVKNLAACALALLTVGVSLQAQAHRAWMLPSATVLSGDEAWVTVDGAISNSVFYFEHHPLRLDQLEVRSPSGKSVEAQNQAQGMYRSVFDVELVEDGTYTLEIHNNGVFARYKLDGETKRWRGTFDEIDEIPDGVDDLSMSETDRRIQVFVTKGAPTPGTFKVRGEGLEMQPITHPNDLFAGEAAQFRFLLDGKAAAGLEVTVIRDGIRYRDQVNEQVLKTNEDGVVEILWDEPGMYWLEAESELDSKKLEDASRHVGYSATLEVLPL